MKINRQPIELPKSLDECHQMIQRMAERIAWLEQRYFGSSKDRRDKYEGPTLFDEEFKEAELSTKQAFEAAEKEVEAKAEKRRARAKQVRKSNRPEKYLYHGLREETRVVFPDGVNLDEYEIIGHDYTRKLHFQQAEAWVECIDRPILRKKADKDALKPEIIQAATPHAIIGGNHVAADMLSQLVVNKYSYHIPEYRQIKMLSEIGVTLPRSTVNNWIHSVAQLLFPLYEVQCRAVKAQGYLQVDEVPWKIADRKGKACRNGYAWQFRDVSAETRGTFFFYHRGSRGAEIVRTQLQNYQGVVQSDGYKAYLQFEYVPGVTTLACWAHVRRKFVDAQKSDPRAGEVVDYIATLYALEENLKEAGATPEQVRQDRQRYAVPILKGIKLWMDLILPTCTPKDPLYNAINYALSLWPRLTRYTENGHYHIDSNPVERGQRPSVLGRKNYLFSQDDNGAEDNATFYTFLVSCDILKVNPLDWLTHTLNRIRDDMTEQELNALLPYNYKAD